MRERTPVAYVPIGPLEWHGPHLPMGTDPLHAEALALEAARLTGGVVHPTLFWGCERERPPEKLKALGFSGDEWIVGMDFPANPVRSLYATEEQFALVVRWTIEALAAHGWKLVVLVNGHGAAGQLSHLHRLAAEFTASGRVRVLYSYSLDEDIGDDVGHASITETAALLALDASRVDLGTLPPEGTPLRTADWGIGDGPTFRCVPTADHTVRPEFDPRIATAELGQRHLAARASAIARMVRAAGF